MSEFARLDLRGLLKLRHLVLRINELRDFQDLPRMDALVNLDVSMNEFRAGAEDTLTCPLPELQRLQFGFATVDGPPEGALTCSHSKLNSFRLFKKFFIERFYSAE